ncbi:hypothetical protein LSTR_LSTR006527 [Laodelphax striatellus]|uniref:Uncharacterized protein n=1 Tax=Laodelphax striatellus TaxID=195883 RepID=A0A482WYZ8_LAOST|nr:hypothetical protein LSTR_LSTR006527 [Laodelphax striatellus]
MEDLECRLDTAMQCSVIPYYKPQCFQLTLDLTKPNEEVKEIDFKQGWKYATINEQTQTVRNIDVGEAHAIEIAKGDRYEKEFVFECTRDFDNYHDEIHGTKFKYHSAGSEKLELETPAKSLFVTTRQELWTCKKSGTPTPGMTPFQRVVTEYVSKVPIERIAHCEGSSLAKVPIPRKEANDRLLYTAVIREIKYFSSARNQSIKYEGKIKFVTQKQQGSNCKSLERNEKEEMSHEMIELLPKWFLAPVDDSSLQQVKDLVPLEFLDYFIVTKRKTWKCKVDLKEFFRTEIIYVGKTDNIGSVLVQEGKTVYRNSLTQANPKSIGVRDIIYSCKNDPNKFMKIDGQVEIYKERSVMEKVASILTPPCLKGKNLDTVIQCSVIPNYDPKCFPLTLDLTKPNKEVKEITDTAFTRDIHHRYAIVNKKDNDKRSTPLDNIEVGSQPTENLGKKLFECTDDFENYRDEIHGTKFEYYDLVRDTNEAREKVLSETPAKSLFITTRRELWICREPATTAQSHFRRVLTEYVSKVPIGEIKYYKGTSLAKVPIPCKKAKDEKLYTVVIREIKYFNSFTNQAINYEGSITFLTREKYYDGPRDWDASRTTVYKDFMTPQKEIERYPGFEHFIINLEGNITLKDEQPFSWDVPDGLKAICRSIEKEKLEKMKRKIKERLPKWSYARKRHPSSSHTDVWNPLEFLDYFIVTMHVTRECTVKTNQGEQTFLRTDIIYVGKVNDIGHVHVVAAGKNVFKHSLTQANPKSIGVREIIYFREADPDTIYDINGKVEIVGEGPGGVEGKGPGPVKKALDMITGCFKKKEGD